MTTTDRLLKELVTTNKTLVKEMKIFNSNFIEFVGSDVAIKLLGRSNPREMKYYRERHMEAGEYREKNKCTFEYSTKALIQLKRKIDSGLVDPPKMRF